MRSFPKIMGIINTTPDSFSDGAKNLSLDDALSSIRKMLELGVDIIDIGGESTRPGAEDVPVQEELDRTMPVIESALKEFPDLEISIDTTKYEVAKNALDLGAEIINDISGLEFDTRLADLAAEFNRKLVLMHIQGVPRTMQNNPEYENVVEDVYKWLENKIEYAKSRAAHNLIIDVGIGFGKTFEHNWELLKNLNRFRALNCPILLGISRKRFLTELIASQDLGDRDATTMLIHTMMANDNMPDIIRVHNVEMACFAKKVFNKLN